MPPTQLIPTVLSMPAWSQTYGGPLTEDDINYLVALIRSSETYLPGAKQSAGHQWLQLCPRVLDQSYQIAMYHDQLKSGWPVAIMGMAVIGVFLE